MLYWHNLNDDLMYVIDLVQLPDGDRMMRFRETAKPSHEHTVFSTAPRLGWELRELGRGDGLSESVPLVEGGFFVLDAHDIWMTVAEAKFWNGQCTQAALQDPNAPWVNGRPPRFPPR